MSKNTVFLCREGLGTRTVLSLNYVGTQGHRLLGDIESNPGNPALCLSLSQRDQVAPGSSTCGPFGENQRVYDSGRPGH